MGKYKEYLWGTNKKIPRKTLYRLKKAKQLQQDKDLIGKSIGLYDNQDFSSSFSLSQSSSINSTFGSYTSSFSGTNQIPDMEQIEELPQQMCNSFRTSSIETNSDLMGLNSSHSDERTNLTASGMSTDHGDHRSGSGSSESNEDTDDNLQNLDDELYAGSTITLKQSLLLTMAHILRFKESKEATSSLLKLLSFHLPGNTELPRSLYLFYKHFEEAKSQYTFHIYCIKCKGYIGVTSKECPFCKINVSVESALEKGNYFLVFDIEEQIKILLRNQKMSEDEGRKNLNSQCLQNGRCYKSLPLGKHDLSITWNTDGVPVFHSSGYSIWPLLYMVNEHVVPGQNNIQIAALWFGTDKPEMNSFLKPFVNQMNKLSSDGLIIDLEGQTQKLKVFPGPLTCDSVARCTLQNLTQFNGSFGCNWCLNEGTSVVRGDGHARIYEVGEYEKRDTAQMKRDAKTALHSKKPVNGVKGATVLMLLSYFNIVEGFVVDYMHAVCQGVVKATTSLWFDSSSHHEEYYIGRKVKEIDSIFTSLKPTDEVTRTPRSIVDRKQWKANEWRSWLIFYSPVIMVKYLPDKVYKHWLNLVLGISILLSEKVSRERIEESAGYLQTFVKKYSEIYGKEKMTYNVHLLVHLHESVSNWGPLWAISCFQFENMNGKLMKLFNGTQKVPIQIADKIAILGKISQISDKAFSSAASDMQDYFENLLRGKELVLLITELLRMVYLKNAY